MDVPEILQPLEWWGFEPTEQVNHNLHGSCPFCGEPTLSANVETGKWICSRLNRCGHQGNVSTFLQQYWEHCREATTEEDIDKLAHWRGVPRKYLDRLKWAKEIGGDRYLLPIRNASGSVVDLRNVVIGGKVKSTKGVKTGLLGLPALVQIPKRPVIVAAGEWDLAAWEWLVKINKFDAVVVAPPGEAQMKPEWMEHMRGRRVYLAMDNDKAGREAMARIGGADGYPKPDRQVKQGKLRSFTRDIRYIHWPKDFPEEGDVNDWVKLYGAKRESFERLMSFFKRTHPLGKAAAEEVVEDKPKKKAYTNGKVLKFEDVAKVFRQYLKMTPEYEDALKLMAATVLTTPLASDAPVWLYLVGPPGSGKTALLMSMAESSNVVFRSSITPHTLVSGWRGADPSLIPELDQKCFVLKDFTEIIKMRAMERDEVFSVLRGAFDGTVERSYGNGVNRHYKSKFTMIAGVTHVIHGLTAKGSAVGERFLKYQMYEKSRDSGDKVLAAIRGLSENDERNEALSGVMVAFLDQKMGAIRPFPLPEWFGGRMVALVNLISMLRTGVERDLRRNITYRPEPEIGTRLAQQLTQLAWGLCLVLDKQTVDEEVWRLTARVGMDTAVGFSRDVVEAMMKEGGVRLTLDAIGRKCDLPKATLRDQMEDLVLLKLVTNIRATKADMNGNMPYLWTVKKYVREMWKAAYSPRPRGAAPAETPPRRPVKPLRAGGRPLAQPGRAKAALKRLGAFP